MVCVPPGMTHHCSPSHPRDGLYHVFFFGMAHSCLRCLGSLTSCQDHVQLRSLVWSKDRLVQKYFCSTNPTQTSCIIPGPGLALCTYHLLSPYLTYSLISPYDTVPVLAPSTLFLFLSAFSALGLFYRSSPLPLSSLFPIWVFTCHCIYSLLSCLV